LREHAASALETPSGAEDTFLLDLDSFYTIIYKNHFCPFSANKESKMASKTKKLKRVRARKDKPNLRNLKENQKRLARNDEILRKLETAQGS
jgi:hypothetical protein